MLDQLAKMPPALAREFIDELSPGEQMACLRELFEWEHWARPAQTLPEGIWSTWVINAGRGFGKTRTGGEIVRHWCETMPRCRVALVARTASDVRDVMVEGESGMLAICPPWAKPHYEPSKRRLTWPNGSIATTFTADEPDLLRGPQFHKAWCDELASWRFLREAWDNLQFGLRLGTDPQVIITTTPKPIKLLREIIAAPSTVVTGGSTYENRANLAPSFFVNVTRQYEGTQVGRQELHAEILDEAEGALWKRKDIDGHRVEAAPDIDRLVVAIDPAVSSQEQSDETGIVAVGSALMEAAQGRPLQHFFVLEDHSGRYSPLEWGRRAIGALENLRGDRIVAEVNNGGEMVETCLRTISADVRYRAVHASRGKQARAEPIASLYEQGRVHHVGVFDELEDQLCNWVPNQNMRSPDRLDALVWAIAELMAGRGDEVVSMGNTGKDRASPWRAL